MCHGDTICRVQQPEAYCTFTIAMIEIKINDSEVQTALRRLLAKAQGLTSVKKAVNQRNVLQSRPTVL